MAKQVHDPGTGTFSSTARMVNKDGSFNVKRIGGLGPFKDTYHYLVNMPWVKFLIIVFLTYTILNTLFALIYLGCGVEHFNGIHKSTLASDFLNCFFFSAQSLTTVGYGNISPATHLTQLIASFEALIGVMSFALITGLFYGRFSKPNARVAFSNVALISPFREGKAIMFRIANKRDSILSNAHVNVLFSKMINRSENDRIRTYYEMPLQFDDIEVMPLSWTLVHPIDEKSPFWNLTLDDIRNDQGEIFVQLKAFDETFNSTVISHYSYTAFELVENASFERTFYAGDGHYVLDLNTLSDHRLNQP
jgi:inward rectifier potassium channel